MSADSSALPPSAVRRLGALFQVLPGEGRLVASLAGLYFALGIAFVLVQTVAFAVFLQHFAADQLPYAYLGVAIVVSLIAWGYLRLAARLPLPRLLAVATAVLLLGTLALRAGLLSPWARLVAFFLPIWFQLVVQLGNVAFWTLAGRLFDVRQGKRLFGVVGTGNWVATIAGGLLTPPLVAAMGTENLLLVAGAALAVALALLTRLTTSYAGRLDVSGQSASGGSIAAQPAASGYVAAICGMIVFWWLGFFVLDNVFYMRAAVQLPAADDLAAFLGLLFAGQGVLALITTSFITGRLLSRFGLRAGLLVMPVTLVGLVVPMAAAGSLGAAPVLLFALAALAKLVNVALGFSLEQAALVVLYQPLPAALRLRVQALAEAIVQPIAVGFAGVLLLLSQRVLQLDATQLACLYLTIAAAWIGMAVVLVRRYPQALTAAISRRRFSPVPAGRAGLASAGVVDVDSLALLRRELHNPHPGAALYAMSVLDHIDPKIVEEALPQLLAHPAPELRRAALNRLERAHSDARFALTRRRLEQDSVPAVRADALRIIASDPEMAAFDLLMSHRDDPDTSVRHAALTGLARGLWPGARQAVDQALADLLSSPRPVDRALVANVLAERSAGDLEHILRTLLHDDDVTVRRAALLAVGSGRPSGLWPLVTAAAGDNATARAATSALVAAGPAALPHLRAALGDPEMPRRTRLRLLQAVGRAGPPSADLALVYLHDPDDDLRGAALAALVGQSFHADGAAAQELEACLRPEALRTAALLAARTDAARLPDADLLRDALDEQVQAARSRIFDLLLLLGDREALVRVREGLASGRPDQRAYALEVLESQITRDLRPILLPLLDPQADAGRESSTPDLPAAPIDPSERLRSLVAGPAALADPWARACAVTALGSLGTDGIPAIEAALRDPEPLVREAATFSLSQHTHVHPAKGNVPVRAGDRHLSTFERVALLRGVSIFVGAPGALLADIASLLREVPVVEGTPLFRQGERGDCMYIVARGRLRVHNGPFTIEEVGERAAIGEMALLDSEPRMASATTVSDTLLLQLDQEPFYELMAERDEVAHGVIGVLSKRLRATIRELASVRARRDALEQPAV